MSAITNHEGQFAAHGGLQLFYQSWAAGDAPTRGVVVIVHGIGEHSSAYSNIVEHLAPAGFMLYGFDLRGHGRSPGQRAFISSWDDYRQDVRAFMRFVQSQQSGQPIFLLGHSLGGIIVLDYALRYPEGLRGVIAIGPAIGKTGISPVLMGIARVVSRVRPTLSMKSGLDAATISRDQQVVATYRADPLVHGVGTARLAAETEKAAIWIQEHASDLHVPLLIQHGGADSIAMPEGSRRFIANVTESDKELHEYPDAFHQVHNDFGHEAAIADLLAWVEKHLKQ